MYWRVVLVNRPSFYISLTALFRERGYSKWYLACSSSFSYSYLSPFNYVESLYIGSWLGGYLQMFAKWIVSTKSRMTLSIEVLVKISSSIQ